MKICLRIAQILAFGGCVSVMADLAGVSAQDDMTEPELRGASRYQRFTVRLNSAYPLPTSVPASTRNNTAERAGLYAYLNTNTVTAPVSIVNGQAFLEGDIHVGSEGSIIVRNFLSSKFGAVVSREDLLSLVSTQDQRTYVDDMAQALSALQTQSIAQAQGLSAYSAVASAQLMSQVTDFLPEIRISIDQIGNFSTGITAGGGIWKDSKVPYVIQSGVSGRSSQIEAAIQCWRDASGGKLIFEPRKNETDYIEFTTGEGCSSFIGRRGGGQPIRLAPACSPGSIVHEIGHALGLYHEQSHPQRDQFVTINWGNIEGWARGNFTISQSSRGLTEYDPSSIMHYGPKAFSKSGEPTIVAKAGVDTSLMGQRKSLMSKDVQGVAALYGFEARAEQFECNFPN